MYRIVTLYVELHTGFQFQIENAWRKKNGAVLSVRNRSYVLVLVVCINVMEQNVIYYMQ